MADVARWLIVLFVLSFAAPILQSVGARAAATDATLVELCTIDGIKQVAVDRAGHPVDRDRSGHHAAHDCTGCLTACGNHATPIGLSSPALPTAGLCAGPTPTTAVLVLARRPAARAPLPPRGPPLVS